MSELPNGMKFYLREDAQALLDGLREGEDPSAGDRSGPWYFTEAERENYVEEYIARVRTGSHLVSVTGVTAEVVNLLIAAPNLAATAVALHDEVVTLRAELAEAQKVTTSVLRLGALLRGPATVASRVVVKDASERPRGSRTQPRSPPTLYIEEYTTPRSGEQGYRVWAYLRGLCVGVSGLCSSPKTAERQGIRMLIKLMVSQQRGELAAEEGEG